jgi:hypothetical protein
MAYGAEKWTVDDLSQAMANAIFQQAHRRFLRQDGDTVRFNGFWRDGDKQNVCAWLNRATWHDAKTGEGGGCKEFAKVAFNITLPEFMNRFGNQRQNKISTTSFLPKPISLTTKSANALAVEYVDKIWKDICVRVQNRHDHASEWLEQKRGMSSPRSFIGSGFASLGKRDIALFDIQHQGFIKHQLSLGAQLIAPIRSVHSSKVQNLFFRALTPASKNEKSRLLPHTGGWSDKDGSPRAFGFPHLIHDFPKLILCEGMADYFATECLLGSDEDFLAIGAANASALINWSTWLSTSKYKGSVIILYQLDSDQFGKISSQAIGQKKATEVLHILLRNKIHASLFKWAFFLRYIKASTQPNDIADICKIFGSKSISSQFVTTLKESN